MNASQKFENSWLKRLHANANAINAGVAVTAKFIAIDGSRIRLQRDLAIEIDRKRRCDPGQELTYTCWFESRGRAAAKEDALHSSAAPFVQALVMFQFSQQSIGVSSFRDHWHDVRIEIAVRALADAVWDVDVEREGR